MKNMKNKIIYFLLQHLRIGGIEIAVTRTANALVKRGYKVCFVLVLPINQIREQLDSRIKIKVLTDLRKDVNVSFLYRLKRKMISRWKIKCFMKSLEDSILISTRNEYNTMMSKYVDASNLRVAQLHHDYMPHKGMVNNFINDYGNVDAFFILTDDVRCEMSDMMKSKNQHTRFFTVPNFISDSLIEEYSMQEERRNFAIAVGRLAPEKGFIRLLEVWKRVQEISSNKYVLYIVGEGSERDTLERKIQDLNLEGRVFLAGAMENKKTLELLRKSKVYCMTSFTEGFPLTILESMACATPQVAFDVRVGPRNLIKEGITGFLIKDGEIDSYAHRIIELFESDETWKRLSQASVSRAKEFSETVVIDKWESIFKEML